MHPANNVSKECRSHAVQYSILKVKELIEKEEIKF